MSWDNGKLASFGDQAKVASSGDNAQLASSGYNTQLASSGDDSVVCGIGYNNIAKASKGSWITLAEWKVIDGVLKPVCVKTEYVDDEKIKANVFYKLENGEFVKV